MDKNNIGTLAVMVPGMPAPVKFGEWKWDSFWSTVSFSDGDSSKRKFFVGSVGQQISGGTRQLTEIDTNVPRAGDSGLPNDWEAFIFSMRLRVLRVVGVAASTKPLNLDDSNASLDSDTPNRRTMFELMLKTLLTFEVNGKPRSLGLVWDYPQAGGIQLVTNQIGESLANNGSSSPRDQQQFVIPIHLRANVSFSVSMNPVAPYDLTQAQIVNNWDESAVEPQCQLSGLIKVAVA